MSIIATLIGTPVRLQRLHAAIRDAHQVVVCDDWSALLAACERQVVHVAVLELDLVATPSFDQVRRLKQTAPRIALLAYATLGADRVRHIFDAGRYGFEELVVADLDDGPSAFARAIERASARGVAALVRGAIPPGTDPAARDAVLISVTRAHERLTPAQLADILGTSPRQLVRVLADAGVPSPHRLLMWGRLIVAGALMDGSRRSTDRIAVALGFP
jgi:AraC-like DNA-binding protein